MKDVKRRLGTASCGKRQLMPERSDPATASKPRDNALVIGTCACKNLNASWQIGKYQERDEKYECKYLRRVLNKNHWS